MTRITTTALGAALLATTVAVPASAETWRTWAIHPEGYPNVVALESFAEDVAAGTEGRIEPQVYPGGVLGAQAYAIEQLRAGAIAVGNFNMGPMGELVPATNVLSPPFIFRDVDHMHKAMAGEIGQRFSDALSECGIVALSWMDSGSRSFYDTKKPIMTPDDMDGLKFRVMSNDLYLQIVDVLGGNATPMAYGEVYQWLKTELMMQGGIAARLVRLAISAVGWMRGGLGVVNVASSMLFDGISGSAVADTLALGSILMPVMKEKGYDGDYAVNVTVTSSVAGVVR